MCDDLDHYDVLACLRRTYFTVYSYSGTNFPAEAGESLTLEVLKTKLNKSLSNVVEIQYLLFFQLEVNIECYLKVHSSLISSLWIFLITLKTWLEVMHAIMQYPELEGTLKNY